MANFMEVLIAIRNGLVARRVPNMGTPDCFSGPYIMYAPGCAEILLYQYSPIGSTRDGSLITGVAWVHEPLLRPESEHRQCLIKQGYYFSRIKADDLFSNDWVILDCDTSALMRAAWVDNVSPSRIGYPEGSGTSGPPNWASANGGQPDDDD